MTLTLPPRNPSLPTPFGEAFAPDDRWLATAEPEEVLEPELPIIDAHHHVWDWPGYRYLIREYVADADCGHRIVATVFNETVTMYRARGPVHLRPVGEVEFCAGVAAMSDSGCYGPTRVLAGILGFADLLLGDAVEEVLHAHIAAGGGRFKGVRFAAGWDADPLIGSGHSGAGPGLYLRPEFHSGVRRLGRMGLSFDAQVYHPQLADVVALAQACPEVPMVLCHCGNPLGYGRYAGRSAEVFEHWRAGMAQVARCPNVSVKLGGLILRLGTYDHARAAKPIRSDALAAMLAPYLQTCIELFSPQRCMVESNFPVDKMGIGYGGMWNMFKHALAGLSNDEKAAVFCDTARRTYRLELA